MKLRIHMIVLGLFFHSVAQAAPIVYFDFDGDGLQDTSTSVALGTSFTAGLYVTNVDSLEGGLLGWGSEINFDNTQLSANSYTIDSQWFIPGNGNNINNAGGSVELFAARLSPGLTGTIKLADINFDTLDIGSSMLTMSELFSGNLDFIGFGGATGYNYDADILFNNADAMINVSAVPLPPAILLFISGLLGLVGIRKLRR